MRRLIQIVVTLAMGASAVACYRLPLRIKENDASGYDDLGIPTIEAVEYTPSGRDLRVLMESPGFVTVIVVDPERGATVRFRRGELQSQYAEKGVHRYALDRLASPMLLSQMGRMGGPGGPQPLGTPVMRGGPLRQRSVDDKASATGGLAEADAARREFLLESRRVTPGSGAVTSVHVIFLVTEQPLNLIGVATRLARGSLDPALVAQAAADVVEGGRWMAAVAPLRGQ